jgi:hypothetical protein
MQTTQSGMASLQQKTERKGHKLKRKDDHGTFATLAKP